uniref:Thyroglobulin type-1 domain-containing protein n=1 Tax=Ascaris lumbricoides TaxID=6252 RepID=A0A0M3IHA8_ASCLU
CRSECLERNSYKIVRVHLSEDFVRAGACQNVTTVSAIDEETTPKSQVFPYICDRRIGIWEIDEQDEEGIVDFNNQCPHVEEVQPEVLESCPKK